MIVGPHSAHTGLTACSYLCCLVINKQLTVGGGVARPPHGRKQTLTHVWKLSKHLDRYLTTQRTKADLHKHTHWLTTACQHWAETTHACSHSAHTHTHTEEMIVIKAGTPLRFSQNVRQDGSKLLTSLIAMSSLMTASPSSFPLVFSVQVSISPHPSQTPLPLCGEKWLSGY